MKKICIKSKNLLKTFCVLFIVSLVLFAISVFSGIKTQSKVYATENISVSATTKRNYQGENNWYYLTGSYSSGNIYRMYYNYAYSKWQGYSNYTNWIDSLDKNNMMPSNSSDAIMAYVISDYSKINITGKIIPKIQSDTSEINAKIILANADGKKDVILFNENIIKTSDINVSIKKEVKAGDVIYFIASKGASITAWDGIIFNTELSLNEVKKGNNIGSALNATSMPMTGDHKISVTNAIINHHPILTDSMKVPNNYEISEGNTYACLLSADKKAFAFLEKNADGSNYYPNGTKSFSECSTGIEANRVFYSNNSWTGYSGMMYYAPSNGKVSILGKAMVNNIAEIYKINASSFSLIKTINKGEVDFANVAEVNDVELKKGEALAIVFVAEAWQTSSATITFDFYTEAKINSTAFTLNKNTYQGEGNWYNYSGNLDNNELYNMFYSQSLQLWQGDKAQNRIYNDRMIQIPTEASDNMRSYIFSYDGTVNIKGVIELYSELNESVDVKIVLCKKSNLNNKQALLDRTNISIENPILKIDEISALQNIKVEIGDAIFLIASKSLTTTKINGAIFKLDFIANDITKIGIPENNLKSSSIKVGTNDYECNYDGNAIRTSESLLVNGMNVDNENGNYFYCYQPTGMQKLINMKSFPNNPGFPYKMEGSYDSVASVWYNRFYSNYDNGFGYAGVKYIVPQDGTISLFGAFIQSTLGGADKDSDKLYTGYKLIKISNGNWEEITKNKITTTMGYFSDDSKTQNISVKQGDVLAVLYVATDAWNASSLSVLFDYMASPVTINNGWITTGDIPEENFSSYFSGNQGENNWYYLYGDLNKGYAKLQYDSQSQSYTSELYSSMTKNKINISNRTMAMKAYRADANGQARIALNANVINCEIEGITVSIYKRKYSNSGYLDAEELFSSNLISKRNFVEYNISSLDLNKGDMVFFCVKGNGNPLIDNNATLMLNTYVLLNKISDGEEISDDIGDSEVRNEFSWYKKNQGENYWFYAYGDYQKYILMDYGFGDAKYSRWNGIEWHNFIEEQSMGIGPYLGTIKMMVCNSDGNISIQGNAGLISSDGDNGILGSIYLNDTLLWSQSFASDNYTLVELKDLNNIKVKKGDILKFYAQNNETKYVAYNSSFNFDVYVHLESDNLDILSTAEAKSFLNSVSYRDYYSIIDQSNVQNEVEEVISEKGCNSNNNTSKMLFTLVPLFYLILRRKK